MHIYIYIYIYAESGSEAMFADLGHFSIISIRVRFLSEFKQKLYLKRKEKVSSFL